MEWPSWVNDGGYVVAFCLCEMLFLPLCVRVCVSLGPSSLISFRESQTLPSRCPHFI